MRVKDKEKTLDMERESVRESDEGLEIYRGGRERSK